MREVLALLFVALAANAFIFGLAYLVLRLSIWSEARRRARSIAARRASAERTARALDALKLDEPLPREEPARTEELHRRVWECAAVLKPEERGHG